MDDIADAVAQLGTGALLAKVDIESAYWLIPVHPQDHPLQAIQWDARIYIDPMLPFGLRLPKIFNAVADALNWYLQQSGIPLVFHYLDDFIIVGPPHSLQCAHSLAILDGVFITLHIPMAAHKREGPTTCLVILSIEIDTQAGELRLPTDKLKRLRSLLQEWGDKRVCAHKELESLIGLLNHACKVVRSGRSFLRRMIDFIACSATFTANDPPQHRFLLRPRMAEHFHYQMEWGLLPFPALPSPPTGDHISTLQARGDARHGLTTPGSRYSGIAEPKLYPSWKKSLSL